MLENTLATTVQIATAEVMPLLRISGANGNSVNGEARVFSVATVDKLVALISYAGIVGGVASRKSVWRYHDVPSGVARRGVPRVRRPAEGSADKTRRDELATSQRNKVLPMAAPENLAKLEVSPGPRSLEGLSEQESRRRRQWRCSKPKSMAARGVGRSIDSGSSICKQDSQ
ncbi:hypothetical protein KM043_006593 [Ampulex compressa]|nr:hypothetical protein KM043_006593 [Ampulex compressa]